jgi:hypothetical protein
MLYIKIKKNNIFYKKNKQDGFVLLFTIMISSIILAITLGVANISNKEIKFGTNAKETNDAFFSTDTGAECALYNDKIASTSFLEVGSSGTVECLGNTFTLNGSYPVWDFVVSGLDNSGQGCVKVIVDKTDVASTIVTAKGYNDGGGVAGFCIPSSNSVERQLQLVY